MISFWFRTNGDADCTEVVCEVETDIPVTESKPLFAFDCGDAMFAELLCARLNKDLTDAHEQTIKLAYEKGRSDGLAKKKKLREFAPRFLEHDDDVSWTE